MALEASGEGDSQAELDAATTGSAKPTSWKWRLQATVCILSGTTGLVMIGMYLFGRTSKRVKKRKNRAERDHRPSEEDMHDDYENESYDDGGSTEYLSEVECEI